jgi:hypothetical protein
MTVAPLSPEPAVPKRNPLIRLLSSVWLGVTLLALIVIYASLVSAFPQTRWALELTDMSAFRHPLFIALGALFFLALLTATFFRTRWTPINAGALITHLGLLMLTAGTFLYFGTKVEGDVRLTTPVVEVGVDMRGRVMGLAAVAQEEIQDAFPASTGGTWTGGGLDLPLKLEVTQTTPDGINPAGTATIAASSPGLPTQTLTLRAADASWQPLPLSSTDPNWQSLLSVLRVRLHGAKSETTFYDDELPALYFDNLTTRAKAVRGDVQGLPIHRDRYLPDPNETVDPQTSALLDENKHPVPTYRTRPALNLLGLHVPTGWFETWRMPIKVTDPNLPFDVEITGYCPYVLGLRDTPRGRHVPVLQALDRRNLGISARSMSAIRVRVTAHDAPHSEIRTDWLAFFEYPQDPDDGSGRLTFTLPGSNDAWRITYSRAEHELKATIAAADLIVTHFPGNGGVDSFQTDFRYAAGTDGPKAGRVKTNETWRIGQYSLYQSAYDSRAGRYSILGVGNFNGVWLWMLGWILIMVGCMYAFYVKPLLLRRLKSQTSAR